MSEDTVKQDSRLVRLAHRMVVVRDLDYLHSIDDAIAKDERERGRRAGRLAEIQSNLGPKWQIAKSRRVDARNSTAIHS